MSSLLKDVIIFKIWSCNARLSHEVFKTVLKYFLKDKLKETEIFQKRLNLCLQISYESALLVILCI